MKVHLSLGQSFTDVFGDVFKDLPSVVRKGSGSDGGEFGDILADLTKKGKHRKAGPDRDKEMAEEDERDKTLYADDGFNGDAFDTVLSELGDENAAASSIQPTLKITVQGFEPSVLKAKQRGRIATAKSKKVDHTAQHKKAQDNLLKKQERLQVMQERLQSMRKRPADPEQAKVWMDSRQALMDKIKEQRDSIQYTESRIAKMESAA